MAKLWKKGRGKLGFFQPLLGRWVADANTEMGPVRCTRGFEPVLGGNYIELRARWEFGRLAAKPDSKDAKDLPLAGKVYEEFALFGVGDDGQVAFWSFTSDGKRSHGTVADVTDLHAEAVGFEADMPVERDRPTGRLKAAASSGSSNPGTPKVGGDSSNMPMAPLERPVPAFPSVE